MTTNHLSRLDPALVRPGRVDLIQLLDDAQPDQAEKLFARFYGRGTEEKEGADKESGNVGALAREVRRIVEVEVREGRRASMAALQGHFILHDAERAVQTLRDCFSVPKKQ
jgi:chaperone BCS1